MIEDKEKEKNSEELNFFDIFSLIWIRRKFISFVTVIFIFMSIIYALSLSNIYRSSALLLPSQGSSELSSDLQGLSSIAGLVGVNLQGQNTSASYEAIKRLSSYDFFINYFLPNINLQDLTSVKEWNKGENKITYDSSYDSSKKIWLKKPSNQEAHEAFLKIFILEESNRSAFIKISINHKSPYIAKDWLDVLILNINESMRSIDKELSKSSMDFLQESLQNTGIFEIKKTISSLLEAQMQKYMLASANKNYVFKVIDSPRVAEKKFSPTRGIIVIFGTLLGFMIGIIYVLTKNYISKNKE